MKKIIVLVIGVLISSCSNDNLIDENSEMLGNLNKVELKINGVNSEDNIETPIVNEKKIIDELKKRIFK